MANKLEQAAERLASFLEVFVDVLGSDPDGVTLKLEAKSKAGKSETIEVTAEQVIKDVRDAIAGTVEAGETGGVDWL